MAVSFVIGRAGTGKTHHCITSIIDAVRGDALHPPILWILPRQATFAAERELACNTSLGGYFRVRVLSFEQLGQEILAECGGASVPEITPLGRQMLLGHLLRRHADELKYFRGVARQPGLAAQLDSTFEEFERSGKDPADFDQLLGAIGGETDALLDKIHDLRLIYNEYTTHLGQERLDQHRRLLQVLACVRSSEQFRRATVFCDGFREFSEFERQMLAALGKSCRQVTITLQMDRGSAVLQDFHHLPQDHSPFHLVERAYRSLRLTFDSQAVPVDEPAVVLKEVHRFQNKAMRFVEEKAIGTSTTYTTRDIEGIEFLDAPDRATEVAAAARRIVALVSGGYRLRDVAVLARDLSGYADLIDLTFHEHGLLHFIDRRRTMSHHPLLRFIRSMLALARGNWPHEAMMDLLKTDLTGLAPAEVDGLENYVLHHRIRGEAWAATDAWSYGETGLLSGHDDADAPPAPGVSGMMDQLRRKVVDQLKPFIAMLRRGTTVCEAVAGIFATLESFAIRQTLAQWMKDCDQAGELQQMAEHEQVWAEIVKLFDEMVDLLGDEAVDAGGFTDILEAGFEQFDLALVPPTVDELLVGQIDRTRTPEVKALLVLGMNDGIFPKVPREGSVLSDTDRRWLEEHQFEVAPAGARMLLDEDLLAYHTFTRPSELLYLSYSRSDAAGRAMGPSRYLERLKKMFRHVKGTSVPREPVTDPRWIGTPRELIASLTRWVRETPEGSAVDPAMPWPALYQWLATRPRDSQFDAWRSLAYENSAALSPEIAARLFPSPLHATARELETFAACPFKHFVEVGLGLQRRDDEEDVSALDLGNVYHHVLEKIVGQLLKRRQSWADLSDAERDRLIHRAAEQIGQKLRGEILLSSARNRYLLNRIERTLGQVVQTQKTGAGRGRMKPARARLRFGNEGDVPELTIATPKGSTVHLSGTIDRVDLHESGDQAAVVDYRLGENSLPLAEVYHGLALQLLTYLLVLEAHGEVLAGRKLTPAAAFYVRTLRKLNDVSHPAEALSLDDPAFHLLTKPRGLFVEEIVKAIDTSLTDGRSQVINCHIRKDGAFASKGTSDLASAGEFAALLSHVKTRIGVLADGILAGEINIKPYLLGKTSPCPQCGYRAICRFQPADHYNLLPTMGREDVLNRVSAEQTGKSDER